MMPKFSSYYITTRASPIKGDVGNHFFSFLYLYLIPSFFSHGCCNPFICSSYSYSSFFFTFKYDPYRVFPFFFSFYIFISILASCIFLPIHFIHPLYSHSSPDILAKVWDSCNSRRQCFSNGRRLYILPISWQCHTEFPWAWQTGCYLYADISIQRFNAEMMWFSFNKFWRAKKHF